MMDAYEVRQKLELVAMNGLSLDSFEDWFVPNSWNVHSDSSPEAIELVSSIHLLLSERDDRILKESDLRRELLSLLEDRIRYVRIDFFDASLGRPERLKPSFESRTDSRPVFAYAKV